MAKRKRIKRQEMKNKKILSSDDIFNDEDELKVIPLAIAGWLRYLFGLDDNLQKFDLSADPLLSDLKKIYENMEIGNIDEAAIRKLLKNETIFGLDLEKAGLADLIVEYLKELSMGKGAVRSTLKKYLR